jgi:LPS O-antigen subunit length determinant protein (WzzB/FepE family)
MGSTRVGGDDSPRRYVLLFAFGVLVGSMVRLGMAVLPRTIVSSVIERVR